MLRIDDEVYVHGYIDEIRKDTIIIRNNGGYFGTEESEVFKYDAFKALLAYESLESEYKAYHSTLYPTGQDSDYWRGVRYALDVIGGEGWIDTEKLWRTTRERTVNQALEIIDTAQTYKMFEGEEDTYLDKRVLREAVEALRGKKDE